MEELKKFKNKIIILSLPVMLGIKVISLPFHGFDWKFTCGLLLGTAIAIVNFNITAISSLLVLKKKNKHLAVLSYLVRLLLYGGVFYIAMRLSPASGIASVCGFMTIKISIFILHGIMPSFKKSGVKYNKDLKKIKHEIFINSPQWVRYSSGRQIVTYRKFVEYKG